MAKRKLTAIQKFRKATIRQRAEQKRLDTDTVEKWRALRRIGIYNTKETPALSRLTKTRRKTIEKKYEALQSLGTYEDGSVYRPLHRHQYEITRTKFDEMGRATKIVKQKKIKYELDKDHFKVLNKKPKQIPSDAIPTAKGIVIGKSSNEKVAITKDGKIQTTEIVGSAKTRFTREPLSGPVEFIQLLEDIRSDKLKFSSKEGLLLYSNGKKGTALYGNAVKKLAERLEHYLSNRFKGMRSFDDWASNSEIVKVRRL